MQYEKLDIVNLVVVIGLVIALITAIFYDNAELSTTISAGLLGYLGGLERVNNKDVTKYALFVMCMHNILQKQLFL